ncbi:small GTP-binding protein, putative [Trichomonas vaginalis G3]|uniref:Small GTP-binding protein, putative n=1 Tax=Trichomonas vaginalis (strain ATCC PRA-98 / G3) TaxID=412133 RepID=A2ECH8_TRIV3|nr:GTPase protein [Trichomonas vaginalis G3]EAY09673.1 small GTP-binding protein, putative [Trichomonas vaginalis G3]KAI5528674.1 GTPase protein [Trichomonas vaginalis G3]|eukprot:XP_001321896.1 small GTP-binding protein [Trichomonas vaginalis G3]
MNYKVILLGDSTVGKTCIANVANLNIFPTDANPTVGANVLTLSYQYGSTDIKLTIWDTAGQEKYRCLAPMYYRNINCAVIIYSILDRKSFESVDYWLDSLQRELVSMPILYLVGNKTDLAEHREVREEEAQEYALRNNMTYLEVSALKDHESVHGLFERISKSAKTLFDERNAKVTPILLEEKKQSKCSC